MHLGPAQTGDSVGDAGSGIVLLYAVGIHGGRNGAGNSFFTRIDDALWKLGVTLVT